MIDRLHHLFLPTLTLVLAYLGSYSLIMRSSILETVREDYLTVARAKGLRDDVMRRHAVPNALLPSVSLIAIGFGYVIGGAITTETVFSYPGLGLATSDAIKNNDLAMLQALFFLSSAALIVANLAADLLYGYLDPRIRGRAGDGHHGGRNGRRGRSGAPSIRQLAWTRRRRTVARFSRQFLADRAGVAGLAILLLFVFVALAAPMLVPRFETTPAAGRGNPDLAPERRVPARHGRDRAQRAGPAHLGSAHQPVHRRGGHGGRRRHRLGHRGHGRVRRWSRRAPAHGHRRLVPRHPVPAAGHRAGGRARPRPRPSPSSSA